MTESEAIDWLEFVPRETLDRLKAFVAELVRENGAQNLIARSTIPQIWARHVVDSAQLLRLAPAGSWLDLGSGPGFPGLIIAAAGNREVSLVESRPKRVDFLHRAADILGVGSLVTIVRARVQSLPQHRFAVISARAFAPLPPLLEAAIHQASAETVWLLPKGRSAASELEATRTSWQGDFRTVPSVTDPESAIIVATGVRPRGRR